MYQFTISESTTSDNPYLVRVLKSLAEMKKQQVKIYCTEVTNGINYFQFRTTSKDVFLGLGSMTPKCQHNLALLLQFEFEKEDCEELLLFIGEDSPAILFTRTLNEDRQPVFTASPAR